MADLNNDGHLDLAMVNGRVRRVTESAVNPAKVVDPFWAPYAERDQLLLSDGDGRLTDVSEENPVFCGEAHVSRGLACGDLDNDGGLDLVVTTIAGPVAVYRNVHPNRGHWLGVRATDPNLNRDAIGAEIYVTFGEKRSMRWINPGYSYLCSNDHRAHFGLGDAREYQHIKVIWPDGSEESFPGGIADRYVEIKKGGGKVVKTE